MADTYTDAPELPTQEKTSRLSSPSDGLRVASHEDLVQVADKEARDGNEEHHDIAVQRSSFKSVVLVLICTTANLLNVSSATSVAIALPTIGRDFGVAEDQLQWLVSAFSLSSGCLLIFFGRLADLHGRKKAFLLGAAWLGVFSIGCGFSKDVVTLYVLRGLSGLGPAATIPACLGILAHAFPPSRARSIAFATFSGGAPVGGAVGTQIGGVLTQLAPSTWRAPFYLLAGLSALCFIGGCFVIDADTPSLEEDKRVDWLGAVLITLGLVFITFVLGQGELAPQGWKTPYIIALLVIGVVLVALFIYWQHHLEAHAPAARPPLMKLSMWARANGKFAVAQVVAFLEWSAFLSWSFWALLYYQDYEGFSPILTAVRLLPMAVTGILINLVIAFIVGLVDIAVLVASGTLLTGAACVLFATIDPTAPYWAFGFPAAVLSVFGADCVFASGTLFVARVAHAHEQSLAGALFQTLTQLGTAFGLAVTTIVHNRVLRAAARREGTDPLPSGDNAPRAAQLLAYRAAQWTTLGFAVLGALLAAAFLRGVGPVGNRRSGAAPVDSESGGSADEGPQTPEDAKPLDDRASDLPDSSEDTVRMEEVEAMHPSEKAT